MQESIQLQRTLKTSISTGPVNQYSDTNQPQLSTYVRFFILLHFIKLFLYVFVFSTTAVLIALTTTAVNVHQIRWNFGPKDRWAVQRGQHQSLSKGRRSTIKQIYSMQLSAAFMSRNTRTCQCPVLPRDSGTVLFLEQLA